MKLHQQHHIKFSAFAGNIEIGKLGIRLFLDAVNKAFTSRDSGGESPAINAYQPQVTDRLKAEPPQDEAAIPQQRPANERHLVGTAGIDHDDLLQVVADLRRQIADHQVREQGLQAAKEAAEKENRIKTEFLGTMSHELRTPLHGVIGMVHLLGQNDPKPDQVEHLQVLKQSAQTLLALINDILDADKIEAGKVELDTAPFDLHQWLTGVRAGSVVNAREKGNLIELVVDPNLPQMVVGDALRLNQIMANLISNAVKFTSNGTIQIEVRQERRTSKGVEIYFAVRDTGIGISEEHQAKIFGWFSQADASINRRFGGTGLGLSITKRLLSLMGADIHLRSRLGEGSEFYFTVRLPIAPDCPIDVVHSKTSSNCPKDLGGARILLAEDAYFNVLIATQLLRGWNAEVVVANDGLQAVELLKTQRFDLVLMDLEMPKMDGFEATVALRAFDTTTPIIALTGNGSASVKAAVIAVGMQGFVSKPFTPDMLYKAIQPYVVPAEGAISLRNANPLPPNRRTG